LRIAALTIVKNGQFFLPIWYEYYCKMLGAENVFVIDNDSTDGCTIGCQNIISAPMKYDFDHAAIRACVHEEMALLLESYDYVMFTDVDEIVSPNLAKYAGIEGFIDHWESLSPTEAIHGVGWQIITDKKAPEIHAYDPLLWQREQMVQLSNFYKPVISTKPVKSFTDYNSSTCACSALYIFHLNHISYEESLRKWELEKTYKWNPRDLATTNSWQHRIKSKSDFNKYFYDCKQAVGHSIDIPLWARDLV